MCQAARPLSKIPADSAALTPCKSLDLYLIWPSLVPNSSDALTET